MSPAEYGTAKTEGHVWPGSAHLTLGVPEPVAPEEHLVRQRRDGGDGIHSGSLTLNFLSRIRSAFSVQCRVPIPVLSVLRTQNLSTEYVPIQIRRKEVHFKDPDAVLKTG
ncbi:unnamed protein product [Boreogadus saida]